jgi:hypothetical protein
VETDKAWFETLSASKPSNVKLHHHEDATKFCESIMQTDGTYDVIVIDSIKHRYGATQNAIKKLAKGGMVIFDNSDWYPNSCGLLRGAGLCQVDFHGFGPVNGYTWTTSIFFKESILLKRLVNEVHPVGGQVVLLEDDSPICGS